MCHERGLRTWANDLAIFLSGDYKEPGNHDWLREHILSNYDLEFEERHFSGRLLPGSSKLYEDGAAYLFNWNGELYEEDYDNLPILYLIARLIDWPLPAKAHKLPGQLIAEYRQHVVSQVKQKFAIGDDSELGPISRRLELTDGFYNYVLERIRV